MKKLNNLVDKAIDHHYGELKRKSALKWSAFNICMLAILTFDIYKTSKHYDLIFYYVEMLACFILLISLFKNVITYFYYSFFIDQIVCENEDQRILLNLNNSNSFIKSKSQVETSVKKQNTESETIWSITPAWSDCKS